MNGDPKKSDWKHFKVVREAVLERMCERILNEVRDIAADESNTFHERHLAAFKAIKDGDQKLESCFDYLSRSRMMMQLGIMNAQGLLEEAEIENFSDEVRQQLESFKRL